MARYSKVVLDSSVVIKWFSKEEGSLSAVGLLDSLLDGSIAILLSELAFYETANALRYKPDFSSEDVERCISKLLQLRLEIRRLDDTLLRETAKISFDGRVTFYDAVPIGIAKLEKIQCITADKETQFLPLSRRGYPVKLLE